MRPIRPEDESRYDEFMAHVTQEDRRLRLFSPMRELSHNFVARLTQIDYAREMAFVAISKRGGNLLGDVRLNADPDYVRAEYAVLVRSDLKGRGLGWRLMEHLIAYARAEGLGELYGTVLAENTTMLQMCRELGFRILPDPDDGGLRHVSLVLGETMGRKGGGGGGWWATRGGFFLLKPLKGVGKHRGGREEMRKEALRGDRMALNPSRRGDSLDAAHRP